MKCENCGAEIPKGDLYCPICGAEVRLVKDYSTIDTMLDEKKRREQQEEKERLEEEARILEEQRKNRPKASTVIVKIILTALATAALGYIIVTRLNTETDNSYIYQKNAAVRDLNSGEYDSAFTMAKSAAKKKNSTEIRLLEARIDEARGDTQSAEKILNKMLEDNEGKEEAAEELLKIAINNKDYQTVADRLSQSDYKSLRKKYARYLSEKPEFSLISGIYPEGTGITLKGSGTIYYTTDGSTPTENSMRYIDNDIYLKNGDNTIKAISVNSYGVKSETATAVYHVDALSS